MSDSFIFLTLRLVITFRQLFVLCNAVLVLCRVAAMNCGRQVCSFYPFFRHISIHYITFLLFYLIYSSIPEVFINFVSFERILGSNFDLWIIKSSSLWLKKIPITGIIFALLYLSLSFALHLFNPLKLYNSSFKDSGWVHGSRRINTTATTPTYFLCTRPERRERDVV